MPQLLFLLSGRRCHVLAQPVAIMRSRTLGMEYVSTLGVRGGTLRSPAGRRRALML